MKQKTIFIVIIFFQIFFLYSCAKEDDSSSGSSSSTTELEGTWATNCFLSGSYYRIQKLEVTGTDAKVNYELHTDSNCNTDVYLYEDTYSSFTVGDEVTFSSGLKGKKFTINIESFKLTPQSSSSVTTLNNASTCGSTDWSLNTAKDYTGLTCGSTTYAAKNTTTRGLYRLDGNNLTLGDLLTSGSYPTSVYTSPIYVKQ